MKRQKIFDSETIIRIAKSQAELGVGSQSNELVFALQQTIWQNESIETIDNRIHDFWKNHSRALSTCASCGNRNPENVERGASNKILKTDGKAHFKCLNCGGLEHLVSNPHEEYHAAFEAALAEKRSKDNGDRNNIKVMLRRLQTDFSKCRDFYDYIANNKSKNKVDIKTRLDANRMREASAIKGMEALIEATETINIAPITIKISGDPFRFEREIETCTVLEESETDTIIAVVPKPDTTSDNPPSQSEYDG